MVDHKEIALRVSADVFFFLLIFFAPWKVLLLVAFIFAILMREWIEIIPFGFFYDTLYGAGNISAVIAAVIIAAVTAIIHKYVSWK